MDKNAPKSRGSSNVGQVSVWKLVISGPGYFDTPFELAEGVTNMGRSEDNDIVLSGDLVSRRHARFSLRDGVLYFEDVGSRNGCQVNQKDVIAEVVIHARDIIQVGENRLTVQNGERTHEDRSPLFPEVDSTILMARNARTSDIIRMLDNVAPSPRATPEIHATPFELDEENVVLHDHAQETLKLTLALLSELTESASLTAFFDLAIDKLMKHVGARTGVVLFRDDQEHMRPFTIRHLGALARDEVPVSDTVIATALEKGEALVVRNVQSDGRFKSSESAAHYDVQQALCVPLGSAAPYLGILYLSRPEKSKEPIESSLESAVIVGGLLNIAKNQFRGETKNSNESQKLTYLARHFPPSEARQRMLELNAESGSLNRCEQRECTVIAVELCGMDSLIEQSATLAADVAREFVNRSSRLILNSGGTIDMLDGMRIRAIFADANEKAGATQALRLFFALKNDWSRYARGLSTKEKLSLRAGAHRSSLWYGMVGDESRTDFVALGGANSVASALCQRAAPTQFIVSEAALSSSTTLFETSKANNFEIGGAEIRAFPLLGENSSERTYPGDRSIAHLFEKE